jgi:hypothetical protein
VHLGAQFPLVNETEFRGFAGRIADEAVIGRDALSFATFYPDRPRQPAGVSVNIRIWRSADAVTVIDVTAWKSPLLVGPSPTRDLPSGTTFL